MRARAPRRAREIAIATALLVVCVVTYAALGNAVAYGPPRGFDAAAVALVGEAPRVAYVFTASCYWYVTVVFASIAIAALCAFPSWRARCTFAILTSLVAWPISDLLKNAYHRPRPAHWVLVHETSYAYSSGHALFAVLIYGWWAVLIARSEWAAVVRIPTAVLLGAWAAAVIWSRLALGAHYPSDLLGGILLGGAALAAGTIVARLVAPNARIA